MKSLERLYLNFLYNSGISIGKLWIFRLLMVLIGQSMGQVLSQTRHLYRPYLQFLMIYGRSKYFTIITSGKL